MNFLLKVTFVMCLVGMTTAIFLPRKFFILKIEKHYNINKGAEPVVEEESHEPDTHNYQYTHTLSETKDAPYTYEYGVKDHKTGDYKSAWEKKQGHNVEGGYTLHDADGTVRVVEYKADKENGFQANVKHLGQKNYYP